MTKKTCPIEDVEEELFSHWCDEQGLTHFHVPQETYTTSWKQKAHNKALGVLEGVSDHWVKIPTPNHPRGSLLIIEFKRQFGNTPTNAQIKFMENMNEINNVAAVCCYGFEEAKQVVTELRMGHFEMFDKCWERTKKIKAKRLEKLEKMKKTVEKLSKSKNDLPY